MRWPKRQTAKTAALSENDPQYTQTVAESVQIAHSVDPGMLETGNFSGNEPCLDDANVDQGLHLEAITHGHPVAIGRCRRRATALFASPLIDIDDNDQAGKNERRPPRFH